MLKYQALKNSMQQACDDELSVREGKWRDQLPHALGNHSLRPRYGARTEEAKYATAKKAIEAKSKLLQNFV